MPTNPYFNLFNASNEQSVLENLIIESIKIYGHDCYYLPRRLPNFDTIYGEDSTQFFDKAYMIEFYIENIDGFQGDGSFFSKFALEIRDQITLVVSKKSFKNYVEINEEIPLIRPREGDVIYFPLNKKCFQIKYATDKPFFYQLGTLQTYEVTCELFEYSHEKFITGIEEIDILQEKFSLNAYDYATRDANGAIITDSNGNVVTSADFNIKGIDISSDNIEIQTESNEVMDWSDTDPFSNGAY